MGGSSRSPAQPGRVKPQLQTERKCLTPGCNYSLRVASRYLEVGVSFPEHGVHRAQLRGLLSHLTIPERGTPSGRGSLATLYEDALHDAIEPAVAAILRANAAYDRVVGNIGNPDGPMRDAAYDAARAALCAPLPSQPHDPQSERASSREEP